MLFYLFLGLDPCEIFTLFVFLYEFLSQLLRFYFTYYDTEIFILYIMFNFWLDPYEIFTLFILYILLYFVLCILNLFKLVCKSQQFMFYLLMTTSSFCFKANLGKKLVPLVLTAQSAVAF